MSKRKTHADTILEYLMEHEGITSLEAIDKFRITRLSAVIFVLRQRGYNIKSVNRQYRDDRGILTQYVQYQLVKEVSSYEG